MGVARQLFSKSNRVNPSIVFVQSLMCLYLKAVGYLGCQGLWLYKKGKVPSFPVYHSHNMIGLPVVDKLFTHVQ